MQGVTLGLNLIGLVSLELRRPPHAFRQHIGHIGIQRNALARRHEFQFFM